MKKKPVIFIGLRARYKTFVLIMKWRTKEEARRPKTSGVKTDWNENVVMYPSPFLRN